MLTKFCKPEVIASLKGIVGDWITDSECSPMGGFAKLSGQNLVVECPQESRGVYGINCKSEVATMQLLLRHVIKKGSKKKSYITSH